MPRQKKQHLKRRSDGRFVCRYKDKWFMADTEAEALAARERYKQAEREGLLNAMQPVTVSAYAAKWLKLYKSDVSDKCYNDYAKQLDALTDAIGKKPLSEVTVDDAASVWEHYAGRSQSLLKRSKMLFTAMFDAAVENNYCQRNPFRSKFAQPPSGKAGTHRTLTDEEIRLIESTPHRMQAAAMVMLYAGLRRGEALALTSDDIDIKKRLIRVTKAVRFDHNRPVDSDPKTDSGTRDVPILSPLLPILKGIKGYVAASASGKQMSETAFRRAWDSYLLALSTAAHHPVQIRPHDLRHTFCTKFVRDAGVDMHQAMVWMGHSDEKMILKIYDHVESERTAASIKQAEKAIKRRQNGRQRKTTTSKSPVK